MTSTVNFNVNAGGTGFDSYTKITVRCSAGSTAFVFQNTAIASGTSSATVSITGLAPGTTYSCDSTVSNSAGTSTPSASESATTQAPPTATPSPSPAIPTAKVARVAAGTVTNVEDRTNSLQLVIDYSGLNSGPEGVVVCGDRGQSFLLSASSGTNVDILVGNLQPSTQYTCAVWVTDSTGQISAPVTYTDTALTTTPLKPTVASVIGTGPTALSVLVTYASNSGLVSSGGGKTTVAVNGLDREWDTQAFAFKRYPQLAVTCGSSTITATLLESSTSTTVVITSGLTASTSYSCKATLENVNGKDSVESTPVSGSTAAALPPSKPVLLSVNPSATSIRARVLWTQGDENGSPVNLVTVVCVNDANPAQSFTGTSSIAIDGGYGMFQFGAAPTDEARNSHQQRWHLASIGHGFSHHAPIHTHTQPLERPDYKRNAQPEPVHI
eukprot:tig00000042_g15439.t1